MSHWTDRRVPLEGWAPPINSVKFIVIWGSYGLTDGNHLCPWCQLVSANLLFHHNFTALISSFIFHIQLLIILNALHALFHVCFSLYWSHVRATPHPDSGSLAENSTITVIGSFYKKIYCRFLGHFSCQRSWTSLEQSSSGREYSMFPTEMEAREGQVTLSFVPRLAPATVYSQILLVDQINGVR
jgi:hypothetical protein